MQVLASQSHQTFFFCLASAVESEAEPNSTQPSSAGSSSVAQRSSILPSISISQPSVGNAQVNEHRKLFGYKKGKQPKRGKSVVKQQRVQTCSLKFVCLASGSSSKPPTSVKERTMLVMLVLVTPPYFLIWMAVLHIAMKKYWKHIQSLLLLVMNYYYLTDLLMFNHFVI